MNDETLWTPPQIYVPSIEDNDFISFTFKNTKSSDLGIYRVNAGSRFNEQVLPAMNNIIKEEQTFYFVGQYYPTRKFTINFAFDDLDMEHLENLRNIFKNGENGDLIFEEYPWKAWHCYVIGQPKINYIPFDKEVQQDNIVTLKTIYKGTGVIQFECYDVFAHNPSGKKSLADYSDNNYKLKSEWAIASGLPTTTPAFGTNYGDIPSPFKVEIDMQSSSSDHTITIHVANCEITFFVTAASQQLGKIYWDSKTGFVGIKDKMQLKFSGNSIGTIPVTKSGSNLPAMWYKFDSGSQISLGDGMLAYNYLYL